MLQENNIMKRRKNGDPEYVVERILDKRTTINGKLQYLVRWRGFTSEGDTWEPKEHLTKCKSHIERYEQALQREKARNEAAQTSKTRDKRNKRNLTEVEDVIDAKRTRIGNARSVATADGTPTTSHFEGKQAKEIVGASNEFEDILFLMKFTDDDLAMVYATVAKERWPQLVIDFYEKRVTLIPHPAHP